MKKLVLILVFILILGCAYAEPVMVNYYEGVGKIDGTNLLVAEQRTGYALMDYDGNVLTDFIYEDYFYFDDGRLRVELNDTEYAVRHGALNLDGSVAIPCKYGDVKILNENWGYGVVFKDATRENYDYEISSSSGKTVFMIDTVDIYNFTTGGMFTLDRSQFDEVVALGNYINIRDRVEGKVVTYDANFNPLGTPEMDSIHAEDLVVYDFNKYYEDGRYGAKDAQGNVIFEPAYSRIYWPEGDHVLVVKNDLTGIIDIRGNTIIEPQFYDIEYLRYRPENSNSNYVYNGYVCFKQDGKLGFANASGVTCEAKYSSDVLDPCGISCTFTDMEGNFNIMAADGVITTVSGYDDVSPAQYACGRYFIVTDEDYNHGLIDWHGNVIFPCEYKSIEFSGDGQYILTEKKYYNIEIYAVNDAPATEEAPVAEVPAEAPAVQEAPAAQEAPVAQSGLGSVKFPSIDFSAMATPEPAPAQEKQSGIGSVQLPNVDFTSMASAPAAAPAAQEAPAAPVEAPAGDSSAAVSMLQSAKALLVADAASNGTAVQVLIEGAASMLAGTPAASILDGAKALLAAGAASNSAAIITLIDSAIALL